MSTSGQGVSVSFPPRTPSTPPPASGGSTSTSDSGVKVSVPPRTSSQFREVEERKERQRERAETASFRPKEMAISSFFCSPGVFKPSSLFEGLSDPDLSGAPIGDKPRVGSTPRVTASSFYTGGGIGQGLSSLIFRFPLNFVRRLSVKPHHNRGNIAVGQIVAASWSNGPAPGSPSSAASAAHAAAATAAAASFDTLIRNWKEYHAPGETNFIADKLAKAGLFFLETALGRSQPETMIPTSTPKLEDFIGGATMEQ